MMNRVFKFMRNIGTLFKQTFARNNLTLFTTTIARNTSISNSSSIARYHTNLSSHFPSLDVLNKITNHIGPNKPILNNYFLIAGQHALNTTGSLLEWIIKELSLPASNIYLIGKSYSNSTAVIKSLEENLKIHYQKNSRQIALGGFSDSYDTDITLLWNRLFVRIAGELAKNNPISGIFVLDDGGHLLKKIPADIAYLTDMHDKAIPLIGIEQTSSGISASKKFPHPIIEVATSAAKQLEAPMIANLIEELLGDFEQIFYKVNSNLNLPLKQLSELSFGIVGLGKIGTATLKHLQKLGYKKLIIFDYDDSKKTIFKHDNVYFATDVVDFINTSDVILGCTGTDFMNTDEKKLPECLNIMQTARKFPKVLISLSSKDTEFNSLLTYIHQSNRKNNNNGIINPLNDILYPTTNPFFIILGGGMPFNFMPVNRGITDYSIPPNDIQLVRGLLAVAILQAHTMMLLQSSKNAGQYKLDPNWQSFVVNAWLESTKQEKNSHFDDINWISQNSGGILCKDSINKMVLNI